VADNGQRPRVGPFRAPFRLALVAALVASGLGIGWLVHALSDQGRLAALTARPALLLAIAAFFVWCTAISVALGLVSRGSGARHDAQDRVVLAALSSLTEGVVVAGSDGRFLLFNHGAERILGVGHLDLPPADWSSRYGCFQPDCVTPFPSEDLPLARALRGETSVDVEVFIRNSSVPDGVWISINGAPLVRGTGPGGGVVTFRDVTARKHAELKLQQAIEHRERQEGLVQQLSNAVEQTADSIFITSRDGVIEYVNRAFETTTGYSREDVIGQTPRVLKSGRHDAAHYREMWRTILSGQVYRSTNINRRKNGEEYHAEQTITPMLDARGVPTHFVSVVKDMTERLRQQKRQFEMECAARVQHRLYPQEAPRVDRFDIAGAVFPADETGGDYFDYLVMPDGGLGVVVADVCGHGLASALIMAETRAYVRSLAANHCDPGEILGRLNAFLLGHLGGEREYVTLCCARLDLAASHLTYASAGHTDGFILGANGRLRAVLPSTGVPLGMFPWASYPGGNRVPLDSDDIVVLLTDGITEAEAPDGTMLTAERALDVIAAHRDDPAAVIVRRLRDFVGEFTEHRPRPDDLTIVVAKVLPQAAASAPFLAI